MTVSHPYLAGRLEKVLPRRFRLALFVLAQMTMATHAQGQPDPESWLKEAEDAFGRVTYYTAIFHKQQRVEGKLLQEETILIKFRKPGSLYMRWVASPYKGGELLYVEGWNNNPEYRF